MNLFSQTVGVRTEARESQAGVSLSMESEIQINEELVTMVVRKFLLLDAPIAAAARWCGEVLQ